jgi:molybdenum cofactor synthesis domain-containing protein
MPATAGTDPTASVIIIGDEILSGKVDDSNQRFFVGQLRELGVRLKSIRVIPDDIETIARVVVDEKPRHDHVFTTGGVGPTHDDVTIEAIARGFGLKLVRRPELVEAIEAFQGGPVDEVLARMADVPEGTELLWAEGLRFPVLALDNVFIFPGEPTILRRKFLAIRERFRATPFHLARVFTTCDEEDIARLMKEAQARHAGVSVGSYPVYDNPEYKVQITVESRDPEMVERALSHITRGIPGTRIVKVMR